MKCPIDSTELQMTARDGVEIDYCPKCRGVWLDRGELDKILDRAMDEMMGPGGPDGPYGGPGGPGGRGRYDDDDDDGRRYRGGPGFPPDRGPSGWNQGPDRDPRGYDPRGGDPRDMDPRGGRYGPGPDAGPGGPGEPGRRRGSIFDIFNV
jgi:Zn-finger nucleic acid-binding protein